MIDVQWETTVACLAPLHEGMPYWFPKVINHVLRFLRGRDRFDLYKTCRALSTGSNTHLNTSQLRDILQRLVGQGLRFTGSHAQKVILNKRLILFWNRFLIPACETSTPDLSVFRVVLRAWRFQDLTANPIMRQLLLPSYRSFTKEHVARHCLQALFSNPSQYKQFVNWQISQLSPAGAELYAALRQGSQLTRDIIHHSNGWLAVCELWRALLVHPSYETRDGEIFLQLDTFKGFENPVQFSPIAIRTTAARESSLEPIRFITSQLVQGHVVPISVCNCRRTFLERQLDFFKESAGDIVDEIREVLGWWHDMIYPGCIQREGLPASDCVLTCSPSGKYLPFIIERHNLEHILEVSLKFELLIGDDENQLTLTNLGRLFITGMNSGHEVTSIWGRNVNRLSLRLGEGWSNGFRRFLELLATSCENDEYVVTPASLVKSGLTADQALVIIGGFTRLDTGRMERLRNWITGSED